YAPLVSRVAGLIVNEVVFFGEIFRKTIYNLERLMFGENGRAGITGLLGAVPILFVSLKVDFGLALLGLGFLQTKYVGLMLLHKILQSAFAHHRSNPIDIPAINFHPLLLLASLSCCRRLM